MKNERENDHQDHDHGENREIKSAQLLFVDLAREHRQLRGVLQMPVHRDAMLLHFLQQMRRIRRGDSLRSEMPPDIEIGGVLFFLDRFVMAARFFQRVVLSAAILIQSAIAHFKFLADARDAFVRDRQLGFELVQFFSRGPASVGAPESGARHFRALFGKANAPGTDPGHLRLEIVRRGNLRL